MTPAHYDLHVTQGSRWRKSFMLMQPAWTYRPITAIDAAAPLRLTVPAHELPASGWPAWVEGTTSPALNRDKDRQAFYQPTVIDEETLELNGISNIATASGGRIAYRKPVDLTDCVPVLTLPAGMKLTVGDGLAVSHGIITAHLTTEQIEQLTDGAWHLTITHADGQSIKWLCGEVKKHVCKPKC